MFWLCPCVHGQAGRRRLARGAERRHHRMFQSQHCGHSLIGELQKGRVYYRCQTADCVTKTIREDRVHEVIEALLRGLILTPDDLAIARERLPTLLVQDGEGDECSAIKLQRNQVPAGGIARPFPIVRCAAVSTEQAP